MLWLDWAYTVSVAIVFDQEIHVDYGQFYVESRTDDFAGVWGPSRIGT